MLVSVYVSLIAPIQFRGYHLVLSCLFSNIEMRTQHLIVFRCETLELSYQWTLTFCHYVSSIIVSSLKMSFCGCPLYTFSWSIFSCYSFDMLYSSGSPMGYFTPMLSRSRRYWSMSKWRSWLKSMLVLLPVPFLLTTQWVGAEAWPLVLPHPSSATPDSFHLPLH